MSSLAHKSKIQLARLVTGQSAVYGLSTLLNQVGGLLVVPIYLVYLDPVDLGIMALVDAIAYWLAPVGHLSLHQALLRFFPEWSEKNMVRQALGAVWGWTLATIVALGLLVASLGPFISPFILVSIPFNPYVALGAAAGLTMSLQVITQAYLRSVGRPFAFLAFNLVALAANLGFKTAAILIWDSGALGVAWATAVGASVTALVGLVLCWPHMKLNLSPAAIRPMLKTSLPLVPGDLILNTAFLGDRLILQRFVSLETLGYYFVGRRIASVVNYASGALGNAWQPLFYRLAHERQDRAEIISKGLEMISGLLFAAATCAVCLAPDLLHLLDGGRFMASTKLIPALALASIMLELRFQLTPALIYTNQSRLVAWGNLAYLAAVAAFLLGLTPYFGAEGAAWGLAAAGLIYLALTWSMSQRLFPLNLRRRSLAWSVLLLFLIGLAVNRTDSLITRAALLTAGCLAFMFLWGFNFKLVRQFIKGD